MSQNKENDGIFYLVVCGKAYLVKMFGGTRMCHEITLHPCAERDTYAVVLTTAVGDKLPTKEVKLSGATYEECCALLSDLAKEKIEINYEFVHENSISYTRWTWPTQSPIGTGATSALIIRHNLFELLGGNNLVHDDWI